MKDPWLFGNKGLEDHFFMKKDLLILAKEMALRNVVMVFHKRFIQVPWKVDLHWLLRYNFRKFELKQDESLFIKDCDEFFVWTRWDEALEMLVKMFWRLPVLMLGLILFGVIFFTTGGF